jgi:hypothetical protein
MTGRPDKYPEPPPGVNRFAWIVRTAAELRRRQAHLVDIERSRRVQAEREALRARARAADEAAEKRGPKQYWRTED